MKRARDDKTLDILDYNPLELVTTRRDTGLADKLEACDLPGGGLLPPRSIVELPNPMPDHDGGTYEAALDKPRLNAQTERVLQAVKSGRWMTLAEIGAVTGDPQASISARLRDLRKEKFGAYTVERRRRGLAKRGLFEYRFSQ